VNLGGKIMGAQAYTDMLVYPLLYWRGDEDGKYFRCGMEDYECTLGEVSQYHYADYQGAL
jgi:hypothetical protein